MSLASLGNTIAVAEKSISGFIGGVSNFFNRIGDGIYSFLTGNNAPTWDNMSLSQLIIAVEDEEAFTQKQLETMMIERDTFLYLLNKVSEYNSRIIQQSAYVELYDEWYDNDTDKYFTEEIKSKLQELSEQKLYTEMFNLFQSIEASRWHTSTITYLFSFTNDLTQDYLLDWQYVYLFASYNAIINASNEEEWEITKESIDNVWSLISPQFIYDENALSDALIYNKGSIPIVYLTDISSYRVTIPYECTNNITNNTHYYYGYLPCLTVSQVSTLYCNYHISYYYDKNTGILEHYVTHESQYLSHLETVGTTLCQGFVFEIFINQLRELPGGDVLADKFEYYNNLREEAL